MQPVNPEPYIAAYGVVVFLVPWLIYGSFIVRSLLYIRKKGIRLFSLKGAAELRLLRQADPYAEWLYQRSRYWGFVTLGMWIVGFAVLASTLYYAYGAGRP